MTFDENVLLPQEKIIFALRSLYLSSGFAPYRMDKFEEYDLYASNKEFLVSDNVITFTDTDGKLMALKPDVTLSIIKNSPDEPQNVKKVFYNESVYRVSKGTGSYKEITQSGVEYFGRVDTQGEREVILLAAKSLGLFDPGAVLAVSDLGMIASVIDKMALDAESEKRLYTAIGSKNTDEAKAICSAAEKSEAAQTLMRLLSLSGGIKDVLPCLRDIPEAQSFALLLCALDKSDAADMIQIDTSVVGDTNYYNGVVFKGFLPGIPTDVLSGGRYDALMRRMDRASCAIGFAVTVDALEDISDAEKSTADDGYVNIALPKGRLGNKVYELFEHSGFDCPDMTGDTRRLIFENAEKKLRFFSVKPSDVPIYVERGAADIGIAGKDILLEGEPEVYELCDLGIGKCRMAVAAPRGFTDDGRGTLRVATKFRNIAKRYYRSRGRSIDVVDLNGSIEIAPILGISDVIFDIVETGTTLRENNLEVVETVLPISARLIAGRAAYKFKKERIDEIVKAIGEKAQND